MKPESGCQIHSFTEHRAGEALCENRSEGDVQRSEPIAQNCAFVGRSQLGGLLGAKACFAPTYIAAKGYEMNLAESTILKMTKLKKAGSIK
jgi:hypothetical protein